MAKNGNQELANDLKKAMSRLIKILRRESRKNEDFSLTEISTLGSIYKQMECTPSKLADREKVTNQLMSQIVKKFCDDGFIKKTHSEKDRRKMIITMTPKGRSFVEEKVHTKKAWLAKRISDKTTQHEQEILEKSIPILEKLTED